MIRIRQIVVVARDLEATVSQITRVLGVRVCYRDPGVAEFGLANALMPIGNQFLEVVSPIQPNTAAGRHLERHGDSGYMLLVQTDDFDRDRARLERLGVRTVWESGRPDIKAVHLHPKDIGAAIVSVDQPHVPEDWPWAGSDWRDFVTKKGACKILAVTIGARDPETRAARWAEVLGTDAPASQGDAFYIDISQGRLIFEPAGTDCLLGFSIATEDPESALAAGREQGLTVGPNAVTICGVRFKLRASDCATGAL